VNEAALLRSYKEDSKRFNDLYEEEDENG